MRTKIVAGNWKMNQSLDEGLKLASEVINIAEAELPDDVKLILAPPYIHLASIIHLLNPNINVAVAAQNCNEHERGAYTGEISSSMLASMKVSHVILGHSERRAYYNESNELLTEKLNAAFSAGLTPIFCCGEPLEIREAGTHFNYVKNQLTESLSGISSDNYKNLIVAYEPIWAIGTGKTASSEQAQEMHATIRKHLTSLFGEAAENTSILYGGSCKPGNAKELFAGDDVDGGLIGGASLNARDFVDIALSF